MDSKQRNLRIFAEILRRKGASVRDAQMFKGDEPWYVAWTWNEREESSFQRWFKTWAIKTLGISAREFDHDRWVTGLVFGLHRRDICNDPEHPHDDAKERDLPRTKWLSVRAAVVALPEEQWPTR